MEKTTATQDSYQIETTSNADQRENRDSLTDLFNRSPLPEEDKMFNLGMYTRSTLLVKFLVMDDLYKRIVNIPGNICEFGTWWGQNLVLMENLRAIHEPFNKQRVILGFDTFEGVPEPKNFDITNNNMSMFDQFKKRLNPDGSSGWINVSIEQVKKNISENVKKTNSTLLVKGKVEQTLLKLENIPDKISLLKLDTILYEPTKIELEKLFNRIHKGGMLIIENYGTYKGIKKAVDEFFINSNYKITYAILTRRAFIYV